LTLLHQAINQEPIIAENLGKTLNNQGKEEVRAPRLERGTHGLKVALEKRSFSLFLLGFR
jgi:hypothetical protein